MNKDRNTLISELTQLIELLGEKIGDSSGVELKNVQEKLILSEIDAKELMDYAVSKDIAVWSDFYPDTIIWK